MTDSEWRKLYRRANIEHMIERERKYYAANRERMIAAVKKCQQNNREKYNTYQREYYRSHYSKAAREGREFDGNVKD